MIRHAWPMLLASFVLTLSADASAWLKFKNKTSSDVWVATARESGAGCLEPYCPTQSRWYRKGWWQIAPNGTKTVYSGPWNEGKWRFYADDQNGHVWAGDPNTAPSSTSPLLCAPWAAHSGCLPVACQNSIDNCPCSATGQDGRDLRYRDLNISFALYTCGPDWLNPADHTVNLAL